jgi:hypothetical protein
MKHLRITPRFIIPSDSTKILRAMRGSRAIDLLDTQELYLSRADNPNFGAYAEAVVSIADKQFIRSEHKKSGRDDWEITAQKAIENLELQRKYTYLACWSITNHETRFIWNTYGKENNSCIFKSTVYKFKNALIKSEYDYEFDIAQVEYIDPIVGQGGIGNFKSLFSRKFDFDRKDEEGRAIVQLHNHPDPPADLRIKININELIDEVSYSHKADFDFIETIKKRCYKLDLKFSKSTISDS